MRSLKRLGAAFCASSMLCTINVANAKIFVGTSQVAESLNLIDKDLIESQNNELIAGFGKKIKKLQPKIMPTIDHSPKRKLTGKGNYALQIRKNNFSVEMREFPSQGSPRNICNTKIEKKYVDNFKNCVSDNGYMSRGINLSALEKDFGRWFDSLKSFEKLQKKGKLYLDYP